jgi:hypothetical protein
MSIIERINTNIPKPVSKTSPNYKAIMGSDPFTPEITILEPEDFNCGAIANELEFLTLYGNYFIDSVVIDTASGDELETLVAALVNIPRRGDAESDAVYRARFKAIMTQLTNKGRTTKWAIRDAVSYLVTGGVASVDVVEFFDTYNLYFEVRISGSYDFEDVLFLDNLQTGFLDQNYLGGIGIGSPVTYLAEILNRIKAVGVDYVVRLVLKSAFIKTVDAKIGTVQFYKTVLADIKVAGLQFTKTVDATIV